MNVDFFHFHIFIIRFRFYFLPMRNWTLSSSFWSIFLCSGATSGELESRSLMDVGYIPDISSFPYSVHLVVCSAYVSDVVNNCAYLCTASLGYPNVVTSTSACATIPTITFSFSGLDVVAFESFKILSTNTNADESIRYQLFLGNRVYVAICAGSPCTSDVNLQTIGRVYMKSVTAVSSKSHFCTTCGSKQPIRTVTIAGQRGGFSLHAGLSVMSASISSPSSSLFIRTNGLIMNLISFDRPGGYSSQNGFDSAREAFVLYSSLDSLCRSVTTTSTDLATFVPAQYDSKPQCADSVTGASTVSCNRDPYMAFTGLNNNQNSLTIGLAGTVVMCACAASSGYTCPDPLLWQFSALSLMAGPVGGQVWAIPVHRVFRLEVTGWGLGFGNEDYLRIVPSTAHCTDNQNNPESLFIKTECPDCSSSTALPIDIPASPLRSEDDSDIARISAIRVYSDHTVLDFSGSIADLLVSNDRIYVYPSDIVVDGTVRASWSLVSENRAYQIAGLGRFADEVGGCFGGLTVCDNELTGHIVTVLDDRSVSIPAGLDEYESVSFGVVAGGANWARHSRITTTETLKGINSLASSNVCWGRRSSSGVIMYYLQAGTLSFYDPPAMTDVTLIPMSRISSTEQPMTLMITPNYLRNSVYSAQGSTRTVTLRITFLDTVEFLDFANSLPSDPTRSASTCGVIFTDFSTNHNDGFPQAAACWYSPTYVDAGVQTRIVDLDFAPSALNWRGIRGICQYGSKNSPCFYNLAFQGVLKSGYIGGSRALRVETIVLSDDDDPYFTIEAFTAVATMTSVSASPAAFTFATTNVAELATNTDVVPFSDSLLQFGFITAAGLQSGNIIRLSLIPQLAWNLTATASCTADGGSMFPTVACTIESQPVGLSRRNVVKLVLGGSVPAIPPLVGPILGSLVFPYYFTVNLVGWTNLPSFYPIKMVAELYLSDVRTSLIAFGTSSNTASNTLGIVNTGRVETVGNTGNGLRPFVAQTGNAIRVQYRLGATVSAGATVSLVLTNGYRCVASGWTNLEPNTCMYTLPLSELIVAGAWNPVDLQLDNPPDPIDQVDNVWIVRLEAQGYPAAEGVFETNATGYQSSISVLRRLSYANIQPTSLLPGTSSVYVYVQVAVRMNPGEYIDVFSPDGFVFDSSVSLLPEQYYFEQSPGLVELQMSDLSSSIIGLKTRVQINRIVDPGDVLGFVLYVQNPAIIPTTPEWAIYTPGEGIELKFNESPFGGWIMCGEDFSSPFAPTFSSLSPYTQFDSQLVLEGLSVTSAVENGTLIVLLPLGFEPRVFTQTSVDLHANEPQSFTLNTRVPSIQSTIDRYAIYVHILDVTGECLFGNRYDVEPIAVVKNLKIESTSQIVSSSNNLITISFRLSTPMASTGWVAIRGDSLSASFEFDRLMNFAPSRTILPEGAYLEVETLPKQGPLSVRLYAANEWEAEVDYSVTISVNNPSEPAGGGIWTVESAADAPQTVGGVSIYSPLDNAVISGVADYRPLRSNLVTLSFETPFLVEIDDLLFFEIVSPPRFRFNEDCGLDVYSQGFARVDCRASQFDDPALPVRVTVNLQAVEALSLGRQIRVQLSVVGNPPIQPLDVYDLWTITLNSVYSSGAIPGFALDQFDDFAIELISPTVDSLYPVKITFSPRHSLPVTPTGPLSIRDDWRGSLYGTLDSDANSGFTIQAPTGFVWSADSAWNDLRNLDTNFRFPATDFYLNGTQNELLIVLIGNSSIDAGVGYSFITEIQTASTDSASSWFMGSFSPTDALDELTAASAPLELAMTSFTLLNTNFDREVLAEDVALSFELQSDWAANAIVVLVPPLGFEVGDDNGDCIGDFDAGSLVWIAIECPDNTLVMRNEGLGQTSTLVTVSISVRNPSFMGTDVTEVFWHLVADNEMGAFLSWRVSPLLTGLSMEVLVSTHRFAAESVSGISLTFTPATEANFLLLNVTEPAGFDFATASSYDYELVRLTNGCAGCIAASGLLLEPGIPITVEITGVKFGEMGGQVWFNLQTFYVSSHSISDPVAFQSTWRDLRLDSPGFFLSGKLTWIESVVESSLPIPVYVSDALNPRVGIPALLLFSYNTTLNISSLFAEDDAVVRIRVELSSPGGDYSVLPVWSNFSIVPPVGELVSVPAITDDTFGIIAEFETIASTLVDYYSVTIPVVPRTFVNTSSWLLNVFANDTLWNSNDGLTRSPSLPSSMSVNSLGSAFTVSVQQTTGDDGRSPPSPNTEIRVLIRLTGPLPWSSALVKIFAPIGFDFTGVNTLCSEASLYCAELIESETNSLAIVPQSAVLLGEGNFDDAALIYPLSVSVTVRTPQTKAASAHDWILTAADSGGWILGWGAVAPILIVPMANCEVVYGGISRSEKAAFILNFQVKKAYTVNSFELIPPPGYLLYCGAVVSFISCTHESTLSTGLLLNVTTDGAYLVPGFYTVPLLIDIPLIEPADNTFVLIARDPVGSITDGNYEIAGSSIHDSQTIAVVNPLLDVSENGEARLSFTLTMATTSVDAITISFPASYYQSIGSESQVGCINRQFPRNPRGFVDASSTQAVTFLVDNTTTSLIDLSTAKPVQLNKVPANQTFVFTFPVIVPTEGTPDYLNYWVLSFCADRNRIAECIDTDKKVALAQLPITATVATPVTLATDPSSGSAGMGVFIQTLVALALFW